jgi:hypothetical protein
VAVVMGYNLHLQRCIGLMLVLLSGCNALPTTAMW